MTLLDLILQLGLTSGLGQAVVIDPAVHYGSGDITVGVDLPIVIASVRQPAGSYLDDTTHGNPVLAVEWRAIDRLTVGLSLAPPLAGDGHLSSAALVTANSISGYARPEAFTRAFAITPRASYTYEPFTLGAALPVVDGDVTGIFAATARYKLLSASAQLDTHAHNFESIGVTLGQHVSLAAGSDFTSTVALILFLQNAPQDLSRR